MMDQSSSAEEPETSLFSVSDRYRDRMAASDSFLNVLLSVMSSSKSLDSSSALELLSATAVLVFLKPLMIT